MTVRQGRLAYGHKTGWVIPGGPDAVTSEALRLCREDGHQWPSGMLPGYFATQEVGTSETCARCDTTRTVVREEEG